MKYFINYEEVTEKDFRENFEEAVRNYVENNIDDIINECYDIVKIGVCEFYPSEILKNCDPIAYKCFISDEIDYQLSEFSDELENYWKVKIEGEIFEIEEDGEE